MFIDLLGKDIEVEISGGSFKRGILIDSGLDIFVLFDGKYFNYIPYVHVQQHKENERHEDTVYDSPPETPIKTDAISFRKTLMCAKGLFVQVYVTGNKSIHGYLTSIMNDYFVFHSPLYKSMLLSMNHVKWLIPYPPNTTPYLLENLPLKPVTTALARSFEEQLKKLENQLLIFDGGDNYEKTGLLHKVWNNNITLITAEGKTVYWNLEHIKTVQLA